MERFRPHRKHDAGLVLVHRLVRVDGYGVLLHAARLARQDRLVASAKCVHIRSDKLHHMSSLRALHEHAHLQIAVLPAAGPHTLTVLRLDTEVQQVVAHRSVVDMRSATRRSAGTLPPTATSTMSPGICNSYKSGLRLASKNDLQD